jgi:hypothetical protein
MALLQGTGKWIRRSWVVPGVNLIGVNTAPLTGGPQFASLNGQVAVSRCYIAALRTTGPLAGQDPLAECYADPDICTGAYGNYAELDLANGITNGVDVGSSSGDQTFVVEMAGPPADQRLSIAADNPADGYIFNFSFCFITRCACVLLFTCVLLLFRADLFLHRSFLVLVRLVLHHDLFCCICLIRALTSLTKCA